MPHPASSRLLVIKLSSLGDVVHTLPLIEALRRGLGPDIQLAWAVRKAFAPLVQANPHLNAVHILEEKSLGATLAFGKLLKQQHFDTVLDPQGLLVSGLLAALSGAPRRIGLDKNREGNKLFLTEARVASTHRAHQVEKLAGFCDALEIPRLAPRRQDYLAGAAPREKNWVGCIIGASTPDKTWPQERWKALIAQLEARGLQPVLLGGPGAEAEAAAQLATPACLNLAGKTKLPELAQTLARCAVVIGADTGPLHLAVAVATPVIGLYGVTDPVKTGPRWGPAPAIVLDAVEKEAPPETRRPRHGTIPDALARISVAAVDDAITRLLS
jgi:heptosyltransferase I